MNFLSSIRFLAILNLVIAITESDQAASNPNGNNNIYAVNEYDPTPKKLPDELINQLIEVVNKKYNHLKESRKNRTPNQNSMLKRYALDQNKIK